MVIEEVPDYVTDDSSTEATAHSPRVPQENEDFIENREKRTRLRRLLFPQEFITNASGMFNSLMQNMTPVPDTDGGVLIQTISTEEGKEEPI